MLMDISLHSNPPEISAHHVNSEADSLMAFPLWNSKMTRFVNFVGTTIAGITEHLDLTSFLRMLFSSKKKLGSVLAFIFFDFLFAEVILLLLSLEYIKVQFVSLVVGCNSRCWVDVVYLLYDVFNCIFKWQQDLFGIIVLVIPKCP